MGGMDREGGGMERERGAKTITLLVKYLPSEQEDLFFSIKPTRISHSPPWRSEDSEGACRPAHAYLAGSRPMRITVSKTGCTPPQRPTHALSLTSTHIHTQRS